MPTEKEIEVDSRVEDTARFIFRDRPNLRSVGALVVTLDKDYKTPVEPEVAAILWRRYKGNKWNAATHDVNTGAPL